jgi:hypothetical protein
MCNSQRLLSQETFDQSPTDHQPTSASAYFQRQAVRLRDDWQPPGALKNSSQVCGRLNVILRGRSSTRSPSRKSFNACAAISTQCSIRMSRIDPNVSTVLCNRMSAHHAESDGLLHVDVARSNRNTTQS